MTPNKDIINKNELTKWTVENDTILNDTIELTIQQKQYINLIKIICLI